ncbi:hypothetical protein CEV34_0190 [Brucella pseudogrignonensis]|uniref:Uncharacterized protein n=1 Tax=Brucella pseudogrignonensis TaxID=419475 RepID=A0A256GTZ0_9HYPH|nr:hypothetical protein CEV34_0190 [Brucella pseudogrignonensis]
MCGIGALLNQHANKCKPCDHYNAKGCGKRPICNPLWVLCHHRHQA